MVVFNLENHIHNMKFVFSWCVTTFFFVFFSFFFLCALFLYRILFRLGTKILFLNTFFSDLHTHTNMGMTLKPIDAPYTICHVNKPQTIHMCGRTCKALGRTCKALGRTCKTSPHSVYRKLWCIYCYINIVCIKLLITWTIPVWLKIKSEFAIITHENGRKIKLLSSCT